MIFGFHHRIVKEEIFLLLGGRMLALIQFAHQVFDVMPSLQFLVWSAHCSSNEID